MFENAELGHTIDKETYEQAVPLLRASLLEAQRQLAAAPFSVLVVVAGSPAAGKSEAVDRLLEWLDVRGVQTHAMRKRTDEERQRPPMWRYWRDLPPRGRTGIFFGGWEMSALSKHLRGQIDPARFDQMLWRVAPDDEEDARGLSSFLMYGYADPAVSLAAHKFCGVAAEVDSRAVGASPRQLPRAGHERYIAVDEYALPLKVHR